MEPGTQITLAPGAGQGIGKLLFDRLLASPAFLDELAQAAHDGLRAMSPRRWDKETETWIQDPDCRTRVQTLFGLLAQAEGDPIKRVIHEHLATGAGPDVLGALRDSPALQAAVERTLEKARWRQSGRNRKEKAVGPVEVEFGA